MCVLDRVNVNPAETGTKEDQDGTNLFPACDTHSAPALLAPVRAYVLRVVHTFRKATQINTTMNGTVCK